MNSDSIKDYARYNLWANKQIEPYLEKFSAIQWSQKDQSSFGSVAETIIHIGWAEFLWTLRLQKKVNQIKNLFTSKEKESVLKDFIHFSEQFTHLIIGYDDHHLKETVPYSTMSGKKYTNSRYDMIHHCINHSTYHRGQVILMMRIYGMKKVPSTDYITFLNHFNIES